MATKENVRMTPRGVMKANIDVSGKRGGTSDYRLLTNKPSINGIELIGNKTNAELGIPTDTQDLTNTAGFITNIVNDLVNYYSKLEIDDILAQIKQSSFRVVDDLPLVGEPGVIYLILNPTPQSRNFYNEYIYADNRWEKIGDTEIDLSGYVTEEELTQILVNYITNSTLNETLGNYYNKADVNEMMAGKADVSSLASVATSGSYNDLINKPDIPDDLADLNEDTTHRTVTDAEKSAWNNKSDFSGSYNDLTDKPAIPDELADLADDTTHRLVTDTEKSTWNAKSDFSGSYNDLTDKPTIPTVNNPTITIQKNGQNVDSFTLNQSGNKSINMVVPTKTSDLSNDSNFINSTVNNLANYYLKTQTYTQAEVDALINAAINGRFRKVNVLPVTGEPNIIYLVPKADPETSDACDEYIWQDNAWELIGNTSIDLSGYITDEELAAALADYLTISVFSTTIVNYYNKTEIGTLLDDKVDKVDGKGLSTYDYDAAAKAIVDSVTANLANKVDKINGKGLSTEDYTTEEKTKLSGISDNANKVESSTTNGNIKIDTVETVVYDDTDLQNKLDLDVTTTAKGNPLSFNLLSGQHSRKTLVDLEPIQDLHGFTKPWVGGAGKNKLPLTVSGIKAESTGGTWSGNDYTVLGITFTLLTDDANNVIGIKATGTASANANLFLARGTNPIYNGMIINGVPVDRPSGSYFMSYAQDGGQYTDYASDFGNGATINIPSGHESDNYRIFIRIQSGYAIPTGGVIFYPMIRVSTETSDFAPYTNICPISGRTSVDLDGCGKNLLDESIFSDADISPKYYPMFVGDGNFTLSTTEPKTINGAANIFLLAGAVSSGVSTDSNGVWLNSPRTINSVNGYVTVAYRNYENINPSDYTTQLEQNTATAYEPYTESNDITVQFGETVYGGQLDVESGVLTVDRGFDTDTWGNMLYPIDRGNNITSKILELTSTSILSPNNKSKCNLTNVEEYAITGYIHYYINETGNRLLLFLPDDTDNSTVVQICYPLANPITIQLTPHQVSLLKGANYITTDGDTIQISYVNGQVATLDPATSELDGLMSAFDKQKLDGISENASNVEDSETNGNILVDGEEVQVYDDSDILDVITTDTETLEGNPLNFNTKSAQISESTLIDLEPIQDLHGFTKPWVGGANINLMPAGEAKTYSANNVTITSDGNGKYTLSGGIASANTSVYFDCEDFVIPDGQTNVVAFLNSRAVSITNGVTFYYYNENTQIDSWAMNPANRKTHYSGMSNKPCNKFRIEVLQGEDLTTPMVITPMICLDEYSSIFSPYKNLCPISGRTEVNLDGCGKNLFNKDTATKDRRVDITTGELSGNIGQYASDYIPILPETQYTNNFSYWSGADFGMVFYDSSKVYISGQKQATQSGVSYTTPFTYTTPVNAYYMRISTYGVDFPPEAVQVEKGSTATTYEPYQQSNDLTISFGQTVYGGKLDVENGELTVDWKYVELGNLSWSYNSTGEYFITNLNDCVIKTNRIYFCSNYEVVKFNSGASALINADDKKGYYQPSNTNLFIKDSAYGSDVSAFTAAMDGVDFVYELATPTTIQLTPNAVNLLKGANYISTDGDKITITYRSGEMATLGDVKEAIDKVDSQIVDIHWAFGTVEYTTLSRHAYEQGDYLIWALDSDLFFIALQPIAIGDALVKGVNIDYIQLSYILKWLENKVSSLLTIMTPPAGLGDYNLVAHRVLGGNVQYEWQMIPSDFDYSHITTKTGTGIYKTSAVDTESGETITYISTTNVTRFSVCNDIAVGDAPLWGNSGLWLIPVPADANQIKIQLASGSMINPVMCSLYHLSQDPETTIRYRYWSDVSQGWYTQSIFTWDMDAIRAEHGDVQYYWVVEVCKSGYGNIQPAEVATYMPAITYIKNST